MIIITKLLKGYFRNSSTYKALLTFKYAFVTHFCIKLTFRFSDLESGRFEALIEFAAAAVACEVLGPVLINRVHRNTFEVQTKTRIISCVTTYLTTWQTANINRVPIGRNKDLGVGRVHMIITNVPVSDSARDNWNSRVITGEISGFSKTFFVADGRPIRTCSLLHGDTGNAHVRTSAHIAHSPTATLSMQIDRR
jgi:hypothetical protein